MKRVLPFFFVLFFVFFVVARLAMTGERVDKVRAELARRGWQGFEAVEPTVETA